MTGSSGRRRRSFAPVSVSVLLVLAALLSACGGGELASKAVSTATHGGRSVVVGCRSAVYGELAADWRSPRQGALVAGPIAWPYLSQVVRLPASMDAQSHDLAPFVKALVVVDPWPRCHPGHPQQRARPPVLDYTRLPAQRVPVADGASAVTFRPCARGRASLGPTDAHSSRVASSSAARSAPSSIFRQSQAHAGAALHRIWETTAQLQREPFRCQRGPRRRAGRPEPVSSHARDATSLWTRGRRFCFRLRPSRLRPRQRGGISLTTEHGSSGDRSAKEPVATRRARYWCGARIARRTVLSGFPSPIARATARASRSATSSFRALPAVGTACGSYSTGEADRLRGVPTRTPRGWGRDRRLHRGRDGGRRGS